MKKKWENIRNDRKETGTGEQGNDENSWCRGIFKIARPRRRPADECGNAVCGPRDTRGAVDSDRLPYLALRTITQAHEIFDYNKMDL